MATVIRIFVLEDSDADFVLLKEYIGKAAVAAGIEASIARGKTFAEVISLADSGHYDLAFVDLNVPDSYGPQTAIELAGHCGGTPMIVVSGSLDNDVASQLDIPNILASYSKNEAFRSDVGVDSNACRLLLIRFTKEFAALQV